MEVVIAFVAGAAMLAFVGWVFYKTTLDEGEREARGGGGSQPGRRAL